ncbi:MAG: DUF4845 domain-containing protein [Acidobacteriota bacterium]|nr:DUF4845 domain-containing protein [Acidobacteriota bacterium]MDE3169533.1 DUF4845 domain-containing protein [Acidobacteriota bacterium]
MKYRKVRAGRNPRPGGAAERGGARVNLVLTVLILVAMAISAIKIVPPYVNNYQLQDSMKTEAEFAETEYPKKTPDDVRQDVLKKAQDLGIPATPQDIQLDMSNGSVSIDVNYSVPVDLYVYQLTLEFHPHADNHTI